MKIPKVAKSAIHSDAIPVKEIPLRIFLFTEFFLRKKNIILRLVTYRLHKDCIFSGLFFSVSRRGELFISLTDIVGSLL